MKASALFPLALLFPGVLTSAQTSTPSSSAIEMGARVEEIRQLRAELAHLSARLDALEGNGPAAGAAVPAASALSAPSEPIPSATASAPDGAPPAGASPAVAAPQAEATLLPDRLRSNPDCA